MLHDLTMGIEVYDAMRAYMVPIIIELGLLYVPLCTLRRLLF